MQLFSLLVFIVMYFIFTFFFFSSYVIQHLNSVTSIYIYIYILWGQGTYDPTHALLGPGARAEEDICRGRMGKGRSVEWNSQG